VSNFAAEPFVLFPIWSKVNSQSVLESECAIYDQTSYATPVWAPPPTTSFGAQTLPLTLNLDPWSMNVVIIQ